MEANAAIPAPARPVARPPAPAGPVRSAPARRRTAPQAFSRRRATGHSAGPAGNPPLPHESGQETGRFRRRRQDSAHRARPPQETRSDRPGGPQAVGDRKSGGKGKRLSGSVDFGGRRDIKKKTEDNKIDVN